ncbi:MAG: hypothetical protein ACNI25_06525 [Halarcobacter sp.]
MTILNDLYDKKPQTSHYYTNNNQTIEENKITFSEELEQSNHSSQNKLEGEDNYEERLWAMFEDIKSLMKTGFKKDELEEIEKIIKALIKSISENHPNYSMKKIYDMVESMLIELKKRITGIAIKDGDKVNDANNNTSDITATKLSKNSEIDVESASLDIITSLIKDKLKNITASEFVKKDNKDEEAKNIKLDKNNLYSSEELELVELLKKAQK